MEHNLLNSMLSEIEVRYKNKVKYSEMRKINSSKDCEEILRIIWSNKIELQEEFYILLVNRGNRCKGWYKVSEGGATGTVADAKIIFAIALKTQAVSIILAHNHPSGNLHPSDADVRLTRRLVEGGKLLEVTVLDHIILSVESYFSFADEGMM